MIERIERFANKMMHGVIRVTRATAFYRPGQTAPVLYWRAGSERNNGSGGSPTNVNNNGVDRTRRTVFTHATLTINPPQAGLYAGLVIDRRVRSENPETASLWVAAIDGGNGWQAIIIETNARQPASFVEFEDFNCLQERGVGGMASDCRSSAGINPPIKDEWECPSSLKRYGLSGAMFRAMSPSSLSRRPGLWRQHRNERCLPRAQSRTTTRQAAPCDLPRFQINSPRRSGFHGQPNFSRL